MANKILYIEDNSANMALVKRLLEAEGHEVIGATDGIEGIKQAQLNLPQLILMDLHLPGLDGYEATSKIKSLKGLENTPIIALTAKIAKADREKALAIGCDGYIPKPIDVDAFPVQVAQYLGGRRDKIEHQKKVRCLERYSWELVDKLQDKVTISKKSLRELSALAKLSGIINKSLDMKKVIGVSLKHIKNVLAADQCIVYRVLGETGVRYCQEGENEGRIRSLTDKIKSGEGVVGLVIQSGKPFIGNDDLQNPGQMVPLSGSSIGIPLLIRGKIWGVLQVILKNTARIFYEDDLQLLKLMGGQICIMMENCMLYEELKNIKQNLEHEVQERTKELSVLLDASRAGAASLNLEQVLNVFSEKLGQLIPNTCCRIALLDEEGENLEIKSVYPMRKLNWDPQLGLVMPLEEFKWFDMIIRSKRNKVFRSDSNSVFLGLRERKFIFEDRFKSSLVLPLTVNGTKIGIAVLHEMRAWERWPFSRERVELCLALSGQMAVYINNALIYENIHRLFLDTIEALGLAVDQRDPCTSYHAHKVTKYAMLIAYQLRLPPEEIEEIREACLLHDIGKLGIRDNILLKPGKLTVQEFEIIKTHPIRAVKILSSIKQLKGIIPIIAHHHEFYDGTGYNSRLKGDEIPLGARILAVADAYDAITSNRVYKKALSKQKALLELKRCAGKQFDPLIVDTFLNAIIGQPVDMKIVVR